MRVKTHGYYYPKGWRLKKIPGESWVNLISEKEEKQAN